MHYVCVVLTGKNIAGAAHVRGQLIDFVKLPACLERSREIQNLFPNSNIAQVANDKVIRSGFVIFRIF